MDSEGTIRTLFPGLEGQLEDLVVVLRIRQELSDEDDESLGDLMSAWYRIGAVGAWGARYRVMLALRPSGQAEAAHLRAFSFDMPGVSARSLMDQMLALDRVLSGWCNRANLGGQIRYFLSTAEWWAAEGREIQGVWV